MWGRLGGYVLLNGGGRGGLSIVSLRRRETKVRVLRQVGLCGDGGGGISPFLNLLVPTLIRRGTSDAETRTRRKGDRIRGHGGR